MNLLSGSPSQNFLNSSFVTYSSGNMNGNPSFNNSSSTGSIPHQTEISGSARSTSPFSRNSPSSFMNSTSMSPVNVMTDDPMELDRFPSPGMNAGSSLNWLDLNMDPASPSCMNFQGVSPKEQFNSGSNVTNMSGVGGGFNEYNGNNTNNIYTNPHAVYGNQNRSQTSILYGSSPKPQDGYISLFDLEGGDYWWRAIFLCMAH